MRDIEKKIIFKLWMKCKFNMLAGIFGISREQVQEYIYARLRLHIPHMSL